jgi:hypothetical protein
MGDMVVMVKNLLPSQRQIHGKLHPCGMMMAGRVCLVEKLAREVEKGKQAREVDGSAPRRARVGRAKLPKHHLKFGRLTTGKSLKNGLRLRSLLYGRSLSGVRAVNCFWD